MTYPTFSSRFQLKMFWMTSDTRLSGVKFLLIFGHHKNFYTICLEGWAFHELADELFHIQVFDI